MYFCPICKNTDILDYGSSFGCPQCTYPFTSKGKVYYQPLEFVKDIFDRIEDKEDILSVQETMALIRVLAGLKKIRKIRRRLKWLFK